MTVREMLQAHPRRSDVDQDVLAGVVEALLACAAACNQCADACFGEDDPAALSRCIRLNLDCADVCSATARVVSRQTASDANAVRPLLEACIAACRSGDECAQHASHMEHCRVCAESCRRCESACRELLRSGDP